jgi:hypothetical protein
MSKYDKASLVHIPSGYKSGTLYNVLPNDADGDFDFTRGSTATRVDENGLIETIATGTPRLNYPLLDGVVQDNPTLLLEPQRTNSYTYSEDFSQWNSSRLETPIAEIVSPDGSVNGYKMQQSSGFTSAPNVYFGSVAAGTYTISIFAKKGTRNYIGISFDGVTYFDVENGVLGSVGSGHTAKIENYGNEWYRCSTTKTITTSQASAFYFADRDNSLTSNDDEGYMYAFGAQLEAGSYPTSYIPTSGSSVTRSADVANGAGTADDFNDSEGVLYANIAALDNDSTNRIFGISDGGDFNNSVLLRYSSVSNTITAQVRLGGIYQCTLNYITDTTLFSKVAFKYKANNFELYADGFLQSEHPIGGTINGLDELSFSFVAGNLFFGKAKEVIAFNEALSDTELEALTSYDSFNSMATELNLTIK